MNVAGKAPAQVYSLSGWGRYPRVEARGRSFAGAETLADHLCEREDLIVYGRGRSYGDSALNHDVVFSRRFDCILDFDQDSGIITCESGVTLAALLEIFVPRGWFLSVSPGTKFVTVGGAIASDVHGKNHHRDGCFSEFLVSFDLMLPDARVLRCSKNENSELFRATCGGMGLTGVILNATFKLRKIESASMRQLTVKANDLEDALHRLEEYSSWTYSAAWVDCLAKGRKLGRGLVTVGEHALDGRLVPAKNKTISVPVDLPNFILNRRSVAYFNAFNYAKSVGRIKEAVVPFEKFFYPLDAVLNWNRMYGKTGFCQYQLALPKAESLTGLKNIFRKIVSSGRSPFLGVLKLCGPENQNPLSFPLEGSTLALDFKLEPGLFDFFDELDRVVLAHGGRLYLAKDARMNASVFRAMYPRWEVFDKVRSEHGLIDKFKSLQSRRLEI